MKKITDARFTMANTTKKSVELCHDIENIKLSLKYARRRVEDFDWFDAETLLGCNDLEAELEKLKEATRKKIINILLNRRSKLMKELEDEKEWILSGMKPF